MSLLRKMIPLMVLAAPLCAQDVRFGVQVHANLPSADLKDAADSKAGAGGGFHMTWDLGGGSVIRPRVDYVAYPENKNFPDYSLSATANGKSKLDNLSAGADYLYFFEGKDTGFYLTGAQELRNGPLQLPPAGFSPDVLAATPTAMLLDFAAVRINPDRALQGGFKINLVLTDVNERHLISIENGVMIHEQDVADPQAGATVRMTRMDLLATLFAGVAPETRGIESDGDGALYGRLAALIDPLALNFNVVTP